MMSERACPGRRAFSPTCLCVLLCFTLLVSLCPSLGAGVRVRDDKGSHVREKERKNQETVEAIQALLHEAQRLFSLGEFEQSEEKFQYLVNLLGSVWPDAYLNLGVVQTARLDNPVYLDNVLVYCSQC